MMKKTLLIAGNALCIFFCFCECFGGQPLPDGFTPIFNGVDLSGWHARAPIDPREFDSWDEEQQKLKKAQWLVDAVKHWTVEDGILVNDGEGPYLVTDQKFSDYELVLEYKITARTDSGIYLKGNPQVQIWDVSNQTQTQHGNYLGSGGLWNNSPGAKGKDPFVLADKPIGEWNHVRVRQIGSRTSVWLNHRMVVDHSILENYYHRGEPLQRSGGIHLQTHGGQTQWRNLGIKELSVQQANEHLLNYHRATFESLFNGKSLDRWQGAVDDYEVVEGAIRCKQDRGGHLLTKEEFANFVARVEFKLPPGGNNGLAIRCPLKGDAAYAGFCELQVLHTSHPKYGSIDPRQVHGSAYGMVGAIRGYLREPGQWNVQEITVNGSIVKVELNGNVILDADLSEVTEFLEDRSHPGLSRTSGFFGFAGHHDPVEYRTVLIRRLP